MVDPMSVSIYQLGYKKLSQIIFEWQAADRASLLALFMTIEVFFHWLWCLYVWWHQESLHDYVNMFYLYPLWIGITVIGLFFWWMIGHLSRIKNGAEDLNKWQVILIVPYTVYIAVVVTMLGYSSLFAGVSLVGGAMLGMMLIKRHYIWRLFLAQIVLILLAISAPYFGINLPNLRQLTITYPFLDSQSYLTYNEAMIIENAIAASTYKNNILGWESIGELQRSSTFFWRATHAYLALPKAIFMVYVFRTLLLVLDNSKNEIVKHANQDELTSLSNRRFGLAQMRKTLIEAAKDQDYSVILLDLDLFKRVNDHYGHEVGDRVLKEVAQVLSSSLADKNMISRYGGEEFLIILPNQSHSQAMIIAERIRASIAEHCVKITTSVSVNMTASLGLYTLSATEMARVKQQYISDHVPAATKFPTIRALKSRKQDKHEPLLSTTSDTISNDMCQSLIAIADKALYKAKDRGRNQVISANTLLAEGALDALIVQPLYGT